MRILKRLKAGLSTKEGKLKALIVVSGISLLVLVLTAGALAVTSTPKFCQSCHEMRPEYVTWNASAHSQINCIQCHIEPGAKNFVVHKVKSLKELYYHFTNQVNYPIETSAPIKDEICEQCHTSNRVVTPDGDIKIPHEVHKQNKVSCITCHSAVVHADVAEKGYTADGNWDKWRVSVGKAYMRKDFLKFSMFECLNCHKEEGAGPGPNDCASCHKKLVKPEGHGEPGFLNGGHGQAALRDITQCDKCHQITKTEKIVKSDNAVIKYTRQNEFCAKCHTKEKPAGHGVDWKKAHEGPAAQNRDGCLVCHDEGQPTGGSIATKTFCYQCHQARQHIVIKISGHPRYPLGNEPELRRTPCLSCHNTTRCLECHYVP